MSHASFNVSCFFQCLILVSMSHACFNVSCLFQSLMLVSKSHETMTPARVPAQLTQICLWTHDQHDLPTEKMAMSSRRNDRFQNKSAFRLDETTTSGAAAARNWTSTSQEAPKSGQGGLKRSPQASKRDQEGPKTRPRGV